jgi:hypothetical protein
MVILTYFSSSLPIAGDRLSPLLSSQSTAGGMPFWHPSSFSKATLNGRHLSVIVNYIDQVQCPPGSWCQNGMKRPCPQGTVSRSGMHYHLVNAYNAHPTPSPPLLSLHSFSSTVFHQDYPIQDVVDPVMLDITVHKAVYHPFHVYQVVGVTAIPLYIVQLVDMAVHPY